LAEQIIKVVLSGSPEEMGFRHGELLSEQIRRNIEFYKPILVANLGDEAAVLRATEHIKEHIHAYNPNYITEIEHIAMGAQVSEPLWVYALNARTELALSMKTNECTAIVFPQQGIIGQTWDWARPIEDDFVMMELQFPSGHNILQITEAGIIGKIGLNSCGLGQTINILRVVPGHHCRSGR